MQHGSSRSGRRVGQLWKVVSIAVRLERCSAKQPSRRFGAGHNDRRVRDESFDCTAVDEKVVVTSVPAFEHLRLARSGSASPALYFNCVTGLKSFFVGRPRPRNRLRWYGQPLQCTVGPFAGDPAHACGQRSTAKKQTRSSRSCPPPPTMNYSDSTRSRGSFVCCTYFFILDGTTRSSFVSYYDELSQPGRTTK